MMCCAFGMEDVLAAGYSNGSVKVCLWPESNDERVARERCHRVIIT